MGDNEEQKPAETLLKRLWLYFTRTGDDGVAGDTKRQIEKILDEVEEQGIIDEDQGDMIHNILFLKDTEVGEIMIPKGDIVALPSTTTIDDLARVFTEEGYSRIPVFEDSLDNIIGVAYAKDLLKYWNNRAEITDIKQLLHPPFFVPEGKKLIDLLKEFKERRTKIAIIIDEYGGVDGMATIADLMEEIVGDVIGEEGDEFEEYVEHKGEGIYTVDPKMPIDEFAETFNLEIPDGDYDTVAGFITSRMERIPKTGERFEYGRIVFEISGADKRRISKLVVHAPVRKEEA
ncbi:MAG: hemolysin family protein [Desulfobacterota bacterium]|nr:hemolysin family protein [Thermodesulfobacteriota bacterium]